MSVFAALCKVNGFGPAATIADSDLAVWIILEWYRAHRAAGGKVDRVAERMLGKVDALNSATGRPIVEARPGKESPVDATGSSPKGTGRSVGRE